MASYLTATQAQDRLLARYGITATLTDGDMDAASDELDALSPFIGLLYATDQGRKFPRSLEPDGSDGDGTVPDNILDAVSLLALEYVEDFGPPVKSEGAMSATVVYERPKRHVNRRRVDALIHPYLSLRGKSA
jgi:hypothetical protein